mmetsp:Transcript_18754/g.29769  ORF Transcript_18754/g.29769 Transcript_18754/m.29769 type:complete len:205 (-) Transcript_18754:610-1224(-)
MSRIRCMIVRPSRTKRMLPSTTIVDLLLIHHHHKRVLRLLQWTRIVVIRRSSSVFLARLFHSVRFVAFQTVVHLTKYAHKLLQSLHDIILLCTRQTLRRRVVLIVNHTQTATKLLLYRIQLQLRDNRILVMSAMPLDVNWIDISTTLRTLERGRRLNHIVHQPLEISLANGMIAIGQTHAIRLSVLLAIPATLITANHVSFVHE